MKHTFIIALCFISITVRSQPGFYFQSFAGPGAANISHVDYTSHTWSDDYTVNFDAGAMVGYQLDKWIFTAGLEYLRTGSKVPFALTDPLGNPAGTAWIHNQFSHVVLPLEVGRLFKIGKKLAFTPFAGVGLSYNISASQKDDFNNEIHHIPGGISNTYTGGTGVYGLAQAELAYPFTPHLSVTLAPTFNYMLSRMIFPQFNPNTVWDHDYSLLFDIGVKWQFQKQKKHSGTKSVGVNN